MLTIIRSSVDTVFLNLVGFSKWDVTCSGFKARLRDSSEKKYTYKTAIVSFCSICSSDLGIWRVMLVWYTYSILYVLDWNIIPGASWTFYTQGNPVVGRYGGFHKWGWYRVPLIQFELFSWDTFLSESSRYLGKLQRPHCPPSTGIIG